MKGVFTKNVMYSAFKTVKHETILVTTTITDGCYDQVGLYLKGEFSEKLKFCGVYKTFAKLIS